MQSIYIYGAGGHGLVVADIARLCGYDDILFVDDGENEHISLAEIQHQSEIPFALGVGSNIFRKKLFKEIDGLGFEIVSLVHPSAIVSQSVTIGRGSIVMANVTINVESIIGEGVILNTACTIEHENNIESFVHISPRVALGGNTTIGADTHVGIGSVTKQGIVIGKNSMIGAGSVVVKNIQDNCIAYGNPCKVREKK